MKKYQLIYLLTILSLFAFSDAWGQYSGTGIFQKITSETELTDGYYVITNVDEEFAMNNQHTGTLFPETSVSLVSGELVNPSAQIVWRIETDGGGRTIYSEDGDIYASYTGSSNNIQAVSAVTGDNQRWTFTYSTDEFVVTNLAVPGRTLRYNSGAPRFVCYGSSFGQNLQLFKLDEGSASSPILDADPFSLSDLDYEIDNGPSAEQSISVSGANLDGSDVTVSVPVSSDFELAETASGTYSNSITLASFDGTATDIFVRLKSGLAVDSYTDDVTISGGDASDITVGLEGEVFQPIFLIYDFVGETVVPAQSPNNATTSNFGISSGSVGYGAFGTWAGSGTPYAVASSGWSETNVNDAKNFFFTIDADQGNTINLSNISFEWRTTGAGPSAITVEINGSEITTFDSGSNEQAILDESLVGFDNLSTVEVKIKGWDNGSRSTSGGGDFRINDVRLDGETIEVTPDYTYESGAWSPSNPVGTSDATDNILIADGSVDITGTLVANNLEVATGATLNVTSSGVLDLAGDITNNGDLVFQSDASGAGQLANFSGSITGDITTERFIPKRSDDARAFRFLASPVGGVDIADAWQQQTHITGAGGASNGFDATTTNNPSMFTYDHTLEDQTGSGTSAAWVAVASTTQDVQAGQPYRLFVRGNRSIDLSNNEDPATDVTLSATGTLHTGTFDVETSNFEDNFTFVGNPYQAVVDLNNLTYGDGVNTNTAYYWDPSLGDNGGFVTITLSSGTPDPSSSDADEFLRPGQAVFIRNNDTGTDYSIQFNEVDKATSGSQLQVFSEASIPAYINTRIYKTQKYNNNQSEEDAFGLRFSEDGNNAVDQLDAVKMGNSGINLASVNNNKLLAIEHRNIPQLEESIAMLLNNLNSETYTFVIDIQNFGNDAEIFLKDKYTDELISLDQGINEIEFTADTSIQESVDILRFEFVFGNVTLSNEEFNFADNIQIYPNPVKDNLSLNFSSEFQDGSVQIQIFDLLGRQMMQSNVSVSDNKSHKIDASNLNSGIYFVKLNHNSKNYVHRFIKL